jgi:hypothetical protein
MGRYDHPVRITDSYTQIDCSGIYGVEVSPIEKMASLPQFNASSFKSLAFESKKNESADLIFEKWLRLGTDSRVLSCMGSAFFLPILT